ncbi:MAG: Flp pilus assembly protein TadG [Paracoccaceae bacterium]|jgi:Flp pilus assembly protein TadG
MFRNSLIRRLRTFATETRGSVSVEFVLVMPFLFWAFMATYVYFDGYRQSSVNLKAAYTISDLISRETNALNDDYIDAMHSLLKTMVRTRSEIRMRISVIRFDEDDDRYYVDWSENRGFLVARDNANIAEIKHRLPSMPDNERVILVETKNFFVPLFNIGMDKKLLSNFIFTRPRFAPQVVFES